MTDKAAQQTLCRITCMEGRILFGPSVVKFTPLQVPEQGRKLGSSRNLQQRLLRSKVFLLFVEDLSP